MEHPEIEHSEECVQDHLVWGECFHDKDGKRINRVYVVKYSKAIPGSD